MSLRTWAGVLMATAMVSLPATAGAETRYGSELDEPPTGTSGCVDCTILTGDEGAPVRGIVVRWHVRMPAGTSAAPATFVVARRATGGRVRRAGRTEVAMGTAEQQTFPARMPIERGDLIGFERPDGAVPVRALPLNTASTYDVTPRLTETPVTMPFPTWNTELAIAADIEADGDRDGFGDETQDLCPTDPATQGACSGTLVGPDITRFDTPLGGGNVVLFDAGGGLAPVVPSDGVLVRWRVRSGWGSFSAVVLRDAGGGAWQHVGESERADPIFLFGPTPVRSFPTRLPVRAGDRLGLHGADGADVRWGDSPGSDVRYFPTLTPGATDVPAPALADVTPAVDADLEPDADRDGHGDVTQDACPTDAATQAACPDDGGGGGGGGGAEPQVVTRIVSGPAVVERVPGPERVREVAVRPGLARLAATRLRWRGGATIAVPLTCPAGGGCTGTVELRVRHGKRTTRLGRATYVLAARARRTVTVRLGRTARAALRRRGGKVSAVIATARAKPTTRAVRVSAARSR